jgi:hypothetical protein
VDDGNARVGFLVASKGKGRNQATATRSGHEVEDRPRKIGVLHFAPALQHAGRETTGRPAAVDHQDVEDSPFVGSQAGSFALHAEQHMPELRAVIGIVQKDEGVSLRLQLRFRGHRALVAAGRAEEGDQKTRHQPDYLESREAIVITRTRRWSVDDARASA